MKITEDILWKGIIEDLAFDFLLFFFPEAEAIIDYDRKIEFLDKELNQLFGESKNRSKHVDKLLKVYTKEGMEKWFLIHVEIQGYKDSFFEERMFSYFYRIYERHKKPITSLAIFTDSDISYFPSSFKLDFLGTKLTYEYNAYKIISQNPELLSQQKNPFSKVILASYYWIKNKKSTDENILRIKSSMIRLLYKNNYSGTKIRSIFEFINELIRFKKLETLHIFEENLIEFNRNFTNMGLHELILEEVKRQLRIEVLAEGKKEGLAEGKVAGKKEGLAEGKLAGKKEGLAEGKEAGKKEGLAEGKELATRNIINQMLEKGYSKASICDILEMPEDQFDLYQVK